MGFKYVYFNEAKDPLREHPNLDISATCTNKCVFCLRQQGGSNKWLYYRQRHKQDTAPDIKTIMDEINNQLDWHNIKSFYIAGYGEPLDRFKYLLDLIKEIKCYKSSVTVGVNTNGHAEVLWPDVHIPLELKQAGVDYVQVSLNAEDPRKYYVLCRPDVKALDKTSYEIYDGIINFIKKCRQVRLKTRVSYVDVLPERISNPLVLPDKEAFEEKVRKLNATPVPIPYSDKDPSINIKF